MRSMLLAIMMLGSLMAFPVVMADTCSPLGTACVDLSWEDDGMETETCGSEETERVDPILQNSTFGDAFVCSHAEADHSGIAVATGVGKLYLGNTQGDPVGTCTFQGDGSCDTEGPSVPKASCVLAIAKTETQTGTATETEYSASNCT